MSRINLQDVYVGRLVRPGAAEFLYELMKERDPEINISHRELPTFEQHMDFIDRRVFRLWYLIDVTEFLDPTPGPMVGPRTRLGWAGYVSATQRNEIGIVLKRSHRGMGYGPEALRLFMGQNKPLPSDPGERNARWLANIAPTNPHSRHVFEKLGFLKIQETFALGG